MRNSLLKKLSPADTAPVHQADELSGVQPEQQDEQCLQGCEQDRFETATPGAEE